MCPVEEAVSNAAVINYPVPYFPCVLLPGLMSREVLFFFGLMMIASVASMGRNWAFTIAGEKFVARLRKKVSTDTRVRICMILSFTLHLTFLAVHFNRAARNGILRRK